MGMSKRAQIFLLAAVIISAVVISLGITANQARVNSEPKNFYDFSYEVQREMGAVMDYEIYTNFSEEDNLEDFADILTADILDNDPDAGFTLVYGTKKNMTIIIHNPKKSNVTSTISIGDDFYKETGKSNKNKVTKEVLNETDLANAEEITIESGDNTFSCPIFLEHSRATVCISKQKDKGNEKFVTVG